MKDDFNDLENINIEEGNIVENNDETSSNSFLKIVYLYFYKTIFLV